MKTEDLNTCAKLLRQLVEADNDPAKLLIIDLQLLLLNLTHLIKQI